VYWAHFRARPQSSWFFSNQIRNQRFGLFRGSSFRFRKTPLESDGVLDVVTESMDCEEHDRREHGDPQILLSLEHLLRELMMCRPRCNIVSRELIVISDILLDVLVVERGTDAKEPANWQVEPKESNVVVDLQKKDVIHNPDDTPPIPWQCFYRHHQKKPLRVSASGKKAH
jgi:hypothetical protein